MTGYNPLQYVPNFALAKGSWAIGKGTSVPEGMNVDLNGKSGDDLGAFQSGAPGPTPAPTVTPTPSPTATPMPTASPTPTTPKFVSGDAVTPVTDVNVRVAPAGVIAGSHRPGEVGQIVSGPTSAPLNGVPVAWYLISWSAAPTEGYSGDDDLIKTVAPSPTPSPSPSPSPTPVTYKAWTTKLNTNQSDWISAHPPYPDGE
jgi:chitinase